MYGLRYRAGCCSLSACPLAFSAPAAPLSTGSVGCSLVSASSIATSACAASQSTGGTDGPAGLLPLLDTSIASAAPRPPPSTGGGGGSAGWLLLLLLLDALRFFSATRSPPSTGSTGCSAGCGWLLLLGVLLIAPLSGCRVAQSQSEEPRRGRWNECSPFCVRLE